MKAAFDTSSEGIAAIIATGESEQVEFKRKLPPESIIARALAAFANTSGGVLLVGIEDDGSVVGLAEDEVGATLARLRSIAASLLTQPVEVGIVELQGKPVAYARVDKVPSHLAPVVTSEGRAYRRKGTLDFGIDFGTTSSAIATLPPRPRKVVAFVAMSFRKEEEPALVDYFRAMARAIEQLKVPIELRRVDLVEGDYEISQRVMEEIDAADIVIADFTLNSRNVYFELGYARGKGRRIVQTARKGTALEFDIRNWRTLFYRNATELEEKLLEEFRQVWDEMGSRPPS